MSWAPKIKIESTQCSWCYEEIYDKAFERYRTKPSFPDSWSCAHADAKKETPIEPCVILDKEGDYEDPGFYLAICKKHMKEFLDQLEQQ